MTNRYADADPVRRLVRRATTSRPLAWLSARVLHRIDRAVARATGGRGTFSGWVSGLPVVLLTTTGARSGLARTTPVLAGPERDRWFDSALELNPGWLQYRRRAGDRAIPVVRLEPVAAMRSEGPSRSASLS